MSPIQLVNAYWAGDNIVAVSRTPQGKRLSKIYPAEYSCFLLADQVTPEIASQLKRWPRIRSWKPEGKWIRVQWRSREDLREATSRLKYPHPEHGGYESLFERLGIDVYEEEADLFFRDLSADVIRDDVFARLLTFPNVVVTGHQAFFTEDALAAIADTTVANLDAFQATGQPPHPVSIERAP